jgi:MFS family permease
MTQQKFLSHDFVLTFISQFSMSSVTQTLMTTLPIYLSTLRATEVEIGVLIGSSSVASLVLRPLVGRLLLSVPEKTFMIGGSLLFAVTSAAYLIASPFWPFLAVRVLQGVALASFSTASVTFIANIVSESRRGQGLSYFFLSFNIALALGPTFGMLVVNRFGFTVLFALCMALSLCSLFTAGKLENKPLRTMERPAPENDLQVVIRIFPPTMMFFIAHIIWGALAAFFPLYAVSLGVSNPGLFFGVYAVVLILGRGLGGRIIDLYSRQRVLLPCLVSYIIGMVVLAYSKNLPMFMVVAILTGAGHAFLMPCLMAYTLDLAGASRGPAMGIISAMGDLGMGAGPVLMGIVLRLANFRIMFLGLAVIGLINFVYFYLLTKKARKETDGVALPP